MMNWEWCKRKRLWPILRRCLGEVRKPTTHLSGYQMREASCEPGDLHNTKQVCQISRRTVDSLYLFSPGTKN
jgi:hypothetical protein